jgi:hypothetical protein
MNARISHDFGAESTEAKARWFQSLTIEERMNFLCEFTDLILENNPTIAEKHDDQPAGRRILVVSKARS